MNKLFDRITAKLKGWRTVVFNVLASVIPVLQMTEVVNIVPAEYMNGYLFAVAMANLYLRWRTNSPLGKKL